MRQLCAATVPGEPASAWHTAGRCSEIPGISTQSRRINGKGQPPCQRRERPYRGKAKEKATEHLPLGFCFFRDASRKSRVTLCHAKVKS